MRRFNQLLAMVACVTASAACYRVTVVTSAAPTATVVDKPWVNSFVVGLVPPSAPIDVSKECATGVSKVVTERSFLNGLVSDLTWNLYTPMHVAVTCGSGTRTAMGLPADVLGTPVTHGDAPAANVP